MFVLHCHWVPPAGPEERGQVLFWAETSAATPRKVRRARGASGARPVPHPFCASPADVADLLATLITRPGNGGNGGSAAHHGNGAGTDAPAPGTTPAMGLPGSVVLRLPGNKFGPLPSPELSHAWTAGDPAEAALAHWTVEGLCLSDREAFEILAAMPLEGEPAPGLSLGTDARFWHAAAGLVLEALAGQRLAPVLAQARGAHQARWLAVLDGPQEADRLARLEAAMPPICRAGERAAAEKQSQGAPFHPSPRWLLDSFVKTMADAMARQWAVRLFDRATAAEIPGAAGLATRLAGLEGAVAPWLRGLFGNDPKVTAPPGQVRALDRSVQAWLRNLHAAGAGDFRVAFRLAPPGAAEPEATISAPADGWQLHYLLQARRDPSLLVPAIEVWQAQSPVLKRLGHRLLRPQDQLLAALGYASRLFPPLTRSLKTARPMELALSTDEAFAFLRETAPLLEQSGFGVLVPPWWNQRGNRLGMRLRARPRHDARDQVAGRLSFEQLIEFQWQLAVGDTMLTHAEFEALVALKSPLVQVRGQWVQLDPEQIEEALRFWQSQRWEGQTSLLGALQMGLDAGDGTGKLPVESVVFEGWLSEWIESLRQHDRVEQLPQPAGLKGELRPYQLFGYSWLEFLCRYGLGPCLADDMGLGKTIETLALLLRDKEEGRAAGPVLLVCPTSVVGNWQREVARFAPSLSVWIHQGNERLHGDRFLAAAGEYDLVVTSYPLARRDARTLQAVQWRGVILDEAQNIKNPEAQQTQAIRHLPSSFRLALTGTPVENRLSELWSIMQFLNPGYLGPREQFRRTFAIPIERYGDEEASRRLRTLVSPLILRRVKTDPRVIKDLPDKLEMKVYCNLSEEQASLYEAVVHESLAQVEQAEGIDRRGQVLSMLLKLKQVCDHPSLFLHQGGGANAGRDLAGRSGKLDRLAEMLEEALAAGDRALIFTQFAEMGHILYGFLPATLGKPALFLHGGTPAGHRDQMVARFQSKDGPPVFILSLRAGGVGLNLTRANHVFHYDRWWNPAVEDQATDRAFRIGQTRNVQVHKFISPGTLEESIDDLIESKRALAQNIVGAGESWLTELTTDKLRELVTLRREAVAAG